MNPAVRALLRYGLPLAVIAALSVYLAARRDDRVHYELPALPPMAAAAVDRVTVERGGARVTLRRTEDGWLIDGPGFAAEPSIVEGMVRAAATLKLTDLIAGEPTYGRYGLGEAEAVTATFLAGTSAVRVLRIGKRAPTYSHTYVLIDDDPRVYQAAGDLTRSFSAQTPVLRDRTILRFEPSEIAAISVRSAGAAAELRRGVPPTPEASPTWSAAGGGERDARAIARALARLAGMRATRFVDTLPGAPPLLELELRSTEGAHRLTIYPESGNAHAAASSDADGPFVLLPALLADVFAAFPEAGVTRPYANDHHD